MRPMLLIAALAATALPIAAQAQAPELAPSTAPQAIVEAPAEATAVLASGAVIVFADPRPVVEAAPVPAANYPLCSATIKDSCRNPDPRKELPYYPS